MVDLGVGWIGELLQQHVAVGICGCHLLRGADGTAHAHAPFGEHQLGPVGREQLAPLQAHGFRHGEGERNALGRRHKGQGDARVAAGGLHQLLARPQQALLLCLPDHGRPNAALHRKGGVPALDLGQHPGPASLGYPVELHQRGFANGEAVVGIDAGHPIGAGMGQTGRPGPLASLGMAVWHHLGLKVSVTPDHRGGHRRGR